jgi:hypothetical protein
LDIVDRKENVGDQKLTLLHKRRTSFRLFKLVNFRLQFDVRSIFSRELITALRMRVPPTVNETDLIERTFKSSSIELSLLRAFTFSTVDEIL